MADVATSSGIWSLVCGEPARSSAEDAYFSEASAAIARGRQGGISGHVARQVGLGGHDGAAAIRVFHTVGGSRSDGVLSCDPDGRNAITEKRQYVFTEWDPTASSDMEALRSYFDTNGDGKLTAADANFAKRAMAVMNADGSSHIEIWFG